jgi:phosphoglycolate phosphatase
MGTVAAGYGYLGSKGECASWGADAHVARPLDVLALLKTKVLA